MTSVVFDSIVRLSRATFNDNYNPPPPPNQKTGNPALDCFLTVLNAKPARDAPNNYRIAAGSFERSIDELHEKYPEDWSELSQTLRYDLIDKTNLTIHTPTFISTTISLRLSSLILEKFSQLYQTTYCNPSTKDLISSIYLNIKPHLRISKNTYHTGAQLQLPDLSLPGVVIQVSKLRPFDSFTEKADRILRDGKGDVKLFIGVNLGSSLDLSVKNRQSVFSRYSRFSIYPLVNQSLNKERKNTVIQINWSTYTARLDEGGYSRSGTSAGEGGGGGIVVRLGDLGREERLRELWPGVDLGVGVRVERGEIEGVIRGVEEDLEGLRERMGCSGEIPLGFEG